MRKKKVNLEFNAIVYDSNSKCLKYTNVLGEDLKTDIIKGIRNGEIYNKWTLRDKVILYLKYHYWAKSEYEVLVTGLSSKDEPQKIDVWFQLQPNIEHIIDYIIKEMQLELK